MTIRHLKIFIAVADYGKMSRAAEALYISQPGVSQAIRELEEYYKIKLFERIANKIYITENGKKMLSYARHIVDSFENMEHIAVDLSNNPQLRIGASVSVGTCILGDKIKQLNASSPNIDTFVTINNTSEIEKMIIHSQLDLGIVEGVVESDDIIKIPIMDDELVIVCGKSHRFYTKKNLTIDMLNGEAVIARESGSSDRNQFEKFLIDHDIHMVKKWTSTNTEAIKSAAVQGEGLAILSKLLVEGEIKSKVLKILSFEGVSINRKFKLIYHKNKFISPEMKCFMGIL